MGKPRVGITKAKLHATMNYRAQVNVSRIVVASCYNAISDICGDTVARELRNYKAPEIEAEYLRQFRLQLVSNSSALNSDALAQWRDEKCDDNYARRVVAELHRSLGVKV